MEARSHNMYLAARRSCLAPVPIPISESPPKPPQPTPSSRTSYPSPSLACHNSLSRIRLKRQVCVSPLRVSPTPPHPPPPPPPPKEESRLQSPSAPSDRNLVITAPTKPPTSMWPHSLQSTGVGSYAGTGTGTGIWCVGVAIVVELKGR